MRRKPKMEIFWLFSYLERLGSCSTDDGLMTEVLVERGREERKERNILTVFIFL